MKKVLTMALLTVALVALTACGGGNAASNAGATVAGAPDSAASSSTSEAPDDTTSATMATAPSDVAASSSSEPSGSSGVPQEPVEEPAPWVVPTGYWQGYDRFSGEAVSGLQIVVNEVTSSSISFDYISPNPDVTFYGLTIYPDGGSAYFAGSNGVELSIYVSDYYISVDEIQGMGAMAYEFRC